MKIVIITPTYNERTNIEKMIPLLENDVFPKIKNHKLFILIVDDKSPDGTGAVVKDFKKKWQNIELLTGEKKGLGLAYVRGMKYAMESMNADAVMEFDSDFQHDPHDIPRLINAMNEGADYVIGSRYISGGSIPKEWGIDRKILSVYGSLFIRIAWLNFKIHDMTSGFKLTKTSFLKRIDLEHLLSKNFSYKIQMLHDIVKLKATVTEVPIVFYERESGKSKIHVKDQFESFYIVLRLALEDRKRFIKFLLVGGTGFVLQFFTVYAAIVLGAKQFIAAMVGGEIAILWNFFANNMWTFSDTKSITEQGSFIIRLLKFNVASLASIGIQGLVVYLAVTIWGEKIQFFSTSLPTSIAILFPTIIFLVIPLNYVIYNKVIWKTHYLKKHDN
ncbi:MAG TPA: glycosyltransferase family 2 protein [Candidatus Sulfotelmatobacter sp.]|jgi:dolichol-phosphate mannosyltransferase|nr:glycosyltransferase family 2 protein [Candidatus Sulfotelmatobacter sp.]